jgi:hypothetical protein
LFCGKREEIPSERWRRKKFEISARKVVEPTRGVLLTDWNLNGVLISEPAVVNLLFIDVNSSIFARFAQRRCKEAY